MSTAVSPRPSRAWPKDALGAYLSIFDELEIRRLALRRRLSIPAIARILHLRENLVRAVVNFAVKLDSGEEKVLLWYGERIHEHTPENPAPRCPHCGGRMQISPCRLCRQREYLTRR